VDSSPISAGRLQHGAVRDGYDAVLFDVDGTLVSGHEPIGGAPETVAALRGDGLRIRFVTNNASRSAGQVADLLRRARFDAVPEEVGTSGRVAASLLAAQLPHGAPVLVVGADALRQEVCDVGLHPVGTAADGPVAVVQGFSAEVGWRELAEACIAIRGGAWWVACNGDVTVPSPRGLLPGNGALVAAVTAATNVGPIIAGKPHPALLQHAAAGVGRDRSLVVGDRLDTDVVAARKGGFDALLVLSGVTSAAQVLAAPPSARPRYLADDVTALKHPIGDLVIVGEQAPWQVTLRGATLHLRSPATAVGQSAAAALRALCAAWWPIGSGEPAVVADDARSRDVLERLGLARVPAAWVRAPVGADAYRTVEVELLVEVRKV
jgi:glycerol 3-phosphatase-2